MEYTIQPMVSALRENLSRAILGKQETVEQIVAALLCGGHVLLSDLPGTGKTTLARALAASIEGTCRRIQFTPDLLPSDLTGIHYFDQKQQTFCFRKGAIFANVVLADEINRTSPKTQSALLEVMEEKQVTIDGVTRRTGDPFIVIATENPVGSAGTQLLPESQLDRFMICVKMGYPSVEEEIEILRRAQSGEAVENVFPILEQTVLLLLQKEVREVFVHERIYRYIAELAKATRENEWTELGISTRGTVALTKMAKAAAYLQGRNYVIPADVMDVFEDVAIHRIILNMKAKVGHIRTEELIRRIVEQVRQPSLQKRR